jgi:uncharacterized LabA/DUF88 family protein
MNAPRPEHSTVAAWEQLDKLAIDYRLLASKLDKQGAHAADVSFLNRTALQCAATRDQIAQGSIDLDLALDIMTAASALFAPARELVRHRREDAS